MEQTVVLSREQADALEELKRLQQGHYIRLVKEKIKDGGWVTQSLRAASTISDEDFMVALYKGYTVEETFRDKVISEDAKNRKSGIRDDWSTGYDSGWRSGVNFVLRTKGEQQINFS